MKLKDVFLYEFARGISLEEYQKILEKIARLEKRLDINNESVEHWEWVLNNMSGNPEQVEKWQKNLSQAKKTYEKNVNDITLLNKKIGRL